MRERLLCKTKMQMSEKNYLGQPQALLSQRPSKRPQPSSHRPPSRNQFMRLPAGPRRPSSDPRVAPAAPTTALLHPGGRVGAKRNMHRTLREGGLVQHLHMEVRGRMLKRRGSVPTTNGIHAQSATCSLPPPGNTTTHGHPQAKPTCLDVRLPHRHARRVRCLSQYPCSCKKIARWPFGRLSGGCHPVHGENI